MCFKLSGRGIVAVQEISNLPPCASPVRIWPAAPFFKRKSSGNVISERRKTMKIPMFFGKKGYWGEQGFIKISFWKWLALKEHYVTKIRWIKCQRKIGTK